MKKYPAACIQMRSGISIAENIGVMEELVREAAAQGAIYIQTPEMSGILQRHRKALFDEITIEADDRVFASAARLAGELGVWLHLGSTAVRAGEQMAANRAGLFSPAGECVATYDKIHMFDVDLDGGETWRESAVYQPGTIGKVVDTGDFRLGMAICYDLRFAQLFHNQAKAGAQILSCPAAFTRQTGRAHWHTLLCARAIENGAFVVAAAQGGDHADGRETFGHSVIINPWGEIIAEIDGEEPGFVVAELDLDEVENARRKIPNLANARPFSIEIVDARQSTRVGAVA